MRTLACILLLLFLPIFPALAGEDRSLSVGLRSGVNATEKDSYFHQHQVYLMIPLPWHWNGPGRWRFWTDIKTAAGMISGGSESAFVGSAGPNFALESASGKISVQLGFRLLVIGADRFGNENFGGPFQAIEDLGITIRLTEHFDIGYHIEHMSNGGVYDGNQGLDLQFLEISYRY
jgi:hypothetical protein